MAGDIFSYQKYSKIAHFFKYFWVQQKHSENSLSFQVLMSLKKSEIENFK